MAIVNNLLSNKITGEIAGNPEREIRIPGLTLLKEIGRGASSIVYLAEKISPPDSHPLYAVKLLNEPREGQDTSKSSQVRREASALARIRHRALIRIMEVGEISGRAYFIMEYVKGLNLSDALKFTSYAEARMIHLVLELSQALQEVHRHKLVHRDIKPQNILIDQEGNPKLIDFGLATQLDHKNETGEMVGTLAYCSPEQIGLLDRPIDCRSDLYSLGIVLFEMCTGALPFFSKDVGKLMKQHAHLVAPDPRKLNPSISPALAKIIAKLLMKDPDDRYQSGSSLIRDLERIQQINSALAAGEDSALGIQALFPKSLFSTPFVGRTPELQDLQDAWSRAKRQGAGIALVTGASGSGKNRVVERFCEQFSEQFSDQPFSEELQILTGTASSTSPVPLTALRVALESYLSKGQKLSKNNRDLFEKKIQDAAGVLAPELKKFSPHLARILSHSPDPKESDQTREQFHESIATFFSKLVSANSPLILILHDVHWLDDSSYQVLVRLLQKSSTAPLFIICSGRDDPQNESELQRFCGFFKKKLFCQISLSRFDLKTTEELISALLGNVIIDDTLSKPIFDRTEGNPFGIEQFLSSMLAEGVLKPYWNTWKLDSQMLSKLDLPTNLEEMMVRRIKSLSTSAFKILGTAALLREEFKPQLVFKVFWRVFGQSELTQINSAIMEAMRSNLIELNSRNNYVFLHDRAQQTLISQFDPDTLRRVHQAIALELDQNTPHAQSRPMDLDLRIANHFNLGLPHESPQRVFETNFAAARHLIREFADDEAYPYCQFAMDILKSHSQVQPSPELQETLGDLCLRIGRPDEGISHLESLFSETKNPLKRAHLCGRLSTAWLYNGSSAQFWSYTVRAFQEIGLPAPKETTLNILRAAVPWFLRHLLERFSILSGRFTDDEDEREKSKILTGIANTAKLFGFFQGKVRTATHLTLRTSHYSRFLGPSRELVYFHMYHALYLAVLGLEKQSNDAIGKAISVAEAIGDRIAQTRSAYYQAFCKFILGREQEAVRLCKTSVKDHIGLSTGDDNVMLTVFHHMTLLLRGKTRDLGSLNKSTQEYFEQKTHQTYKENHGFLISFNMATLALEGKRNDASELFKRTEEYFQSREDYLSQVWVNLCCQAFLFLELGETGSRVDRLIQTHESYGPHRKTDMIDVCSFYIPKAHLRLAQWLVHRKDAAPEIKNLSLRQLQKALQELKRVGRTPLMIGHWVLVSAVLDHELGNSKRAESRLKQVEKIGFEVDSPWLLYESAKLRAGLFKTAGNTGAAEASARIAMHFATEQGWENRISWLKSHFNFHDAESSRSSAYSVQDSNSEALNSSLEQMTTHQSALLKRNMDALLELATASANILDPDEQAQVALRETVRLLGAERGLLFLSNEQGDTLTFKIGIDSNGALIPRPDNYSKSVTHTVQLRKEPVVFTGSSENSSFTDSIIANNLRSIIATPLIMKDRFIGALYLDSRIAKGIFSNEDLGILKVLGNHFAIAIETAKTARLEIEKKALQKDLELTRAVQALILPKSQDYTSDFISVAAYLQSATQVGGDWWWLDKRENGKIRVLLGDVTGHGAGPAMVTAIIASSYKTMQEKQKDAGIPEILSTLDHILLDLCGGNYWMTLSAVEIDPHSGVVEWWNACAPPLFLMRPDDTIEVLESEADGPLKPIGSDGLKTGYQRFVIKPGEKLMLFTDGLFEFKHQNGEEFGLRRLKNLLTEPGRSSSAQQLREKVRQKSAELVDRGNLEDDITFVAIERPKLRI